MEEICSRYDDIFMKDFLESHRVRGWCENMKILLTDYKYNPKSLANYICNIQDYEALSLREATSFLLDFLQMNIQMGVAKPEKYPRHLHTTHDIVVRNFNAFKVVHDKEVFDSLRRGDLEYKGKDYSIIYPKCYTEVQKEGANLNHCVASYVENIMKGLTHIVFLRLNKSLNESLVTVEVKNNTIVQHRGSYNRSLSQNEMDFLKIYAEKKNLKLN